MENSKTNSFFLAAVYWVVVGIPLAWGIWKTALKLPALFQ